MTSDDHKNVENFSHDGGDDYNAPLAASLD
jgi:hypothetical protein